ncbi:MAG: cysteine desulfurase [Pseudomonadota bacterium]
MSMIASQLTPQDIDLVRAQFPLLSDGPQAHLAYLDNAATTQKPQAVLDAMTRYYCTANSNVGRGYYTLSMDSTDRFEAARCEVQRAIGARYPAEVVFTTGTTASINLLAESLGAGRVGPGDRVVITGMEHNSNLLAWRRLCERSGAELVIVPFNADGHVELEAFVDALDDRVRLAAFTHISNVLGTVNPVREMTEAAHACGALVVVDGAQAVPHRPIDVTALGVDFYCFSAHKMYGPMGTGVLYGRLGLLEELPPYQVGGGTVKAVSHSETVNYVPVPERFEAGTPNVAGAVGLAAAFRFLAELGWDEIIRHNDSLVRHFVDAVDDLPGVRVIGDPAREPSGIVSIDVDGIHPYDVGGHLNQAGIAVRCGVHCASTFLDDLGLLGTVRVSFGVYNTLAEVDRVVAALATVAPGEWTRERPDCRFV